MRKKIYFALSILAISSLSAFAGNPDRAGASGASQLLLTPWTRTAGLMGSNVASSVGAEAIFSNVAGLAFTKKTNIAFSSTDYLRGSDIFIGSLGFAQKLGESGVFGINVVSMDYGDLEVTTTDKPDGGVGTFAPNMTNIGFSYAKTFSNSIYGGFTLRYHQESIANISGSGLAFDAGIRYVTGSRDNIRIGIALKNVGPPYKYGGDGTSIETVDESGNTRTFFERTAGAELPSLINIGFAYDFLLAEKHELTLNGSFISNSFTTDDFTFSLEYNFNNRFQIRGGYLTETKPESAAFDRLNAKTGLGAGASVMLPINKDGGFLSIDYGYQATQPFNGIQSIGLSLTL